MTDSLGTRLESAEAELSVQADQIASKVSLPEYATQTRQTAEAIELVSGRVSGAETALTIKADQAELLSVRDGLQAQLTTIPGQIESAVSDVRDAVSNHETRILQNEESIESKASKSEIDTLTGRVLEAETSLTLKADQATLNTVRDGLQSQISAVPGQITSAVNDIVIGGRN